MKKFLSQILVFSFLLTGYCPLAFGNAHKSMDAPMNHVSHDTSLSQDAHNQVDCCEEGMPDVTEGSFQPPDELDVSNARIALFDEFSLETEPDPPHWNYFANNLDPPHLNLTGTIISLE